MRSACVSLSPLNAIIFRMALNHLHNGKGATSILEPSDGKTVSATPYTIEWLVSKWESERDCMERPHIQRWESIAIYKCARLGWCVRETIPIAIDSMDFIADDESYFENFDLIWLFVWQLEDTMRWNWNFLPISLRSTVLVSNGWKHTTCHHYWAGFQYIRSLLIPGVAIQLISRIDLYCERAFDLKYMIKYFFFIIIYCKIEQKKHRICTPITLYIRTHRIAVFEELKCIMGEKKLQNARICTKLMNQLNTISI